MSFSMVALSAILSPVDRGETPVPGKLYRQIGVRLWGEGAYEREPIDGAATQYQRLFQAKANDVIVNKIWARNGSVAVVPENLDGCYGSNEFPMFAPIREKLEPRWFHWMTKTKDFWSKCDEKSRGTSGKNRIRPERFLAIEIPLPSLLEQLRIVTRIEELADRINEALALRQRVIEEAQALRESLLRELFDGNLGEGWIECPLQDVVGFQEGPGIRTHQFRPKGIPMLNIGNMKGEILDLTKTKFLDPAKVYSRYAHFLLNPKDYVMASSGATIGKLAEVRAGDTPLMLNTSIIRFFSKSEDILLRRFLWYFLHSGFFLDQVLGHRTGSAQPNMGPTHLKKTNIRFPRSLEKQRRIISHLDTLQDKMDALSKLHSEASIKLDALLPSVLDSAFRRRL